MQNYLSATIFVVILLLIYACGYDSGTGPNNATPTLSTFSSIQDNVFTPSCAVSGCHNGTQPPRLSRGFAFNSIVNVRSTTNLDYIEPGNANSSYLYRKITGSGISGARMPYNRSPLSAAIIDSIEVWIENGALNN